MDLAGGGDSGGVRVLAVYGVYGGSENDSGVKDPLSFSLISFHFIVDLCPLSQSRKNAFICYYRQLTHVFTRVIITHERTHYESQRTSKNTKEKQN